MAENETRPGRGAGSKVAFDGAPTSLAAYSAQKRGTTPVAVVERVDTDRYGVRTVLARCPYCGRLHRHGWPADADEPGSRVAHCSSPGAYRVVIPC